MTCKCERNIINRIYYDSKEKERCITCKAYINESDAPERSFSELMADARKKIPKIEKKEEPTHKIVKSHFACEQCGGLHYVRAVRVFNTKDKTIFLCGYCDHANKEEIKRLTPQSETLNIEAINKAGTKLKARKKIEHKHKIHRVKTLTYDDIEALHPTSELTKLMERNTERLIAETRPKTLSPKKHGYLQTKFIEHNECCYYCKKKSNYFEITIDHFRPRSKKGGAVGNRLFSCKDCNGMKGDKSFDEFRSKLMNQLRSDKPINKKDKSEIQEAINTCSLIINGLIKPPLF